MSLLRFLGLSDEPKQAVSAETETVRKITHQLDTMETQQARYIAAFAYILSRVARADLKVTDEETQMMERIAQEAGGLSAEQAVLVVQIAKTQNLLFGATEDFLVTREFRKIATNEQCLQLLECLFAVAATDRHISGEEDHITRRIATELGIEHPDYIAVRSAFREHLSFLKR
jgi:uncharacterized tellurite resistance protein B-like protein